MANDRWQRWLELMTPRSGRVRCEDGDYVNFGDWYQAALTTALDKNVIGGNASAMSMRLTGLAGGGVAHYFVLDVPPGKELYVYQRCLGMTEGRYTIDAINFDSVDLTGATQGVVSPLDEAGGEPVETTLNYTTNTPTNIRITEFCFADTGTGQGAARASGVAAVAGVIRKVNEPVGIRVIRETAGTFTVNLSYVAWEETP